MRRPRVPAICAGRAVLAGSFVMVLHHGHGGHGRYYDASSGCDDGGTRGCDVRLSEPLARDAFAQSFPLTADLAFPLRLTLSAARRASRTLAAECF